MLSIHSSSEGLRIRAGIHETDSGGWTTLKPDTPLTLERLRKLKRRVEDGIEQRLVKGKPYNKADEHWFQSVLRDEPWILGLEHPILREVPAWRPLSGYAKWSRSFIDLVGVDGLGDIHVVETKISRNIDDLFVFQGLDYFVWSLAYKDWLSGRLSTSRRVADPTIQYVVGANTDGSWHVSQRAPSHLAAIDVPWRFRTVSGWFTGSEASPSVETQLLPVGEVPKASGL